MCERCGCGDREHEHGHGHPHGHQLERLEERVLAKNDQLAAYNRQLFAGRRLVVINVMSSPGAGKTTLLTRTLPELSARGAVAVIEADQAGRFDADRIAAAGISVVQVNTGSGCHIAAEMVADAVARLDPPGSCLLFIENVGNLVCPALFDLGESSRVVLLSVAEGDDKPEKYPHMFAAADLLVITKIDLLPHVDFDRDRVLRAMTRLNPRVAVLELSARSGSGIHAWLRWLEQQRSTAPM